MGTYLGAVDLVTQNQLTIVARIGINPSDRLLGDVNPGQATITVNNSSVTARQVGPLMVAEFNVPKSLSLVDNMGGGQRFSTGPALTFYSNPLSGYASFNQQSGFNFGSLSLTATNFTSQLFNTPGTYSWTVPTGVTSISVAGIGGGGGGSQKSAGGSGGGGGLVSYSNSIAVTPGTTCTIVVGGGGATGGSYGLNGSSTYLLLPGTNIPIVIAQGGAGGDSIFWTSNSIGVSYFDVSGIITTQTAYDPAGGTISYSVSSGSLPSGASLNTSTGAISWVAQSVSTSTEYTFTLSASNGSQSITKPFTLKVLKFTLVMDYLLVGGGGGAGYDVGGGGGGGGVIVGASLPIVTSSTVVTITIGSGGGSNTDAAKQGNNGQPTVAAFSGTTGTSVYSGVFNGTSQYLTTPATANYNLYQTSFTIECWVYVTSFSQFNTIWALGTNGVATYTQAGIGTDGSINFQTNSGSWAWTGIYNSAPGVVVLNRWTHIAFVRDYAGGTLKMFANGQQQYTSTTYAEANGSGGTAFIGTYYGALYFFAGRISNFRLVNGVAVYTGNFVVPTPNLSTTQSSSSNIAAISGSQTVLLTLQNATFIDNSSNIVSITNVNAATTTAIVIPIPVVAFGGGGGGSHTASWNTTPLLYGSGLSGGSGGGGGTAGTNPGGASTQYSYSSFNGVGYGYAGGASWSSQWGGGGGGGAGGVGTAGTGGFVDGGAPYTSSISGSSANYAGGGYGNSDSGAVYVTGYNSSNVLQGYYGYGANGTGSPNGSSYNGNPGIAIIRYPGSIQYGSGGTTSTSGGYVIHTFTATGILTF